MKKPLLVAVIAAALLAVGVVFVAVSNTGAPAGGSGPAASFEIEKYTPQAVSEAPDGEKVVLFFHATWCSTCKLLADDIVANADQVPDDVRILLVDYDSSTELKQRYGVAVQHTLVQVNSDGDPLETWRLTRTLDELLSDLS